MHDGPERLTAFIEDMNAQQSDFIIQLEDFCRPYDTNRIISDIWNCFVSHVITSLGITTPMAVSPVTK